MSKTAQPDLQQANARILFVPHGGGPMPLLGDPEQASLTRFLQTVPARLGQPEAIIMISAHWEMPVPHVTAGASPELIYDYGGFPPEAYAIQYPAPGAPALAADIASLLEAQGVPCMQDAQRGFDHGMFVPLKLMYPEAAIPVIQLSLLANLDAGAHVALGQALAPLRDRNLLIVGSGMTFHNLRAFFLPGLARDTDNEGFETWLRNVCTSDMPENERTHKLTHWMEAPGGLQCHPRPEHLLPLQVCYGMAGKKAEVVFDDKVIGKRVSGYLWT